MIVSLPSRRLASSKKVSYPRSQVKALTLCIAVKCFSILRGPQVVCCYDAQVGNDYESTESEIKWHLLSPHICTMFSGPLNPARDLIKLYKKAFRKTRVPRIGDYRDVLWKPMQDFTDMNQNKPYLESTDVQLLAVALVEGSFRILSLDANGPRDHPHFGAIGTGGDSATAMLRWRKPTDRTHLGPAEYYAYEAKKLGEVSPHVGKRTYMKVLSAERNLGVKNLKAEEIVELEEKFKRLGPQPYS